MIFVDTNVFMYAVGRKHPLRQQAQQFFFESLERRVALCTSAEVLQELVHAYLPVKRHATLDAAFSLVRGVIHEVFAIEPEDVYLARSLATKHPGVSARDLVHKAVCLRRSIERVETYDRALEALF